jgi:hypothetical protein
MISASRAGSRAGLAACCAVFATLALALSACGGDTSASAGEAEVEVTAKESASLNTTDRLVGPQPHGRQCAKQLGGFVEALQTLRKQLDDGLSYERYVEEIDALRARYDELPAAKLTLGCLSNTATPAEKAFGRYLEAANAWAACIDESGCEAATVEPLLQERWRSAGHFLDKARAGLRA